MAIQFNYLQRCLLEKSVHSRRNSKLFFDLMTVESIRCLFLPFISTSLPFRYAVVTFASSPLEQNIVLDLTCFHIFVPFHDSQILPGTVMGLKNNLPNFASAYDTQTRVASSDGIFCSRYFTGLLLRDAFSNVNFICNQRLDKNNKIYSQCATCSNAFEKTHQCSRRPAFDTI